MITVRAGSFDTFVQAFVWAVQLDGEPAAVGGNAFTLPDDVDPTVVRALTDLGVDVDGAAKKTTTGSTARKRERE